MKYSSIVYTTLAVLGSTSLTVNAEDTVPPEVKSFTCKQDSVTVDKNSQEITCTVHVTDNRGVEYTSVYFNSPSYKDTMPLFYTESNRISGNAKDGVYEASFTIPKNSENGYWDVSYDTWYKFQSVDINGNKKIITEQEAYDNNFTQYIKVISETDNEPPVINSLKCKSSKVNVMEEEQEVTCTVNGRDNLSGLNRVNAHFASPSGASLASFYFNSEDGIEQEDGTLNIDATAVIPLGVEPGNYTLVLEGPYRLFTEDNTKNHRIYDNSVVGGPKYTFPGATFEVVSEFDTNGPYVTNFECDKSNVLLAKGETETISCRAVAQDDISGLERVLVTYYSPSGKDYVALDFNADQQDFGRAKGGIFNDKLQFSHDDESGAWVASNGITAIDRLGNIRIYDMAWMSKNNLPTFFNVDKVTLNGNYEEEEGETSGANSISRPCSFVTFISLLLSYAVLSRN